MISNQNTIMGGTHRMFSAIRKRLTYTNVALTLALVFAMSGGAYAASKYLITSTKQIKPSVLKQLQGKTGAAGAQGPQGPQGPAGANGKDGANGKEGLAGKEGLQGKEGKEGLQGKEGKEGKAGAEGKEGSPWTAGGTLPSGKTETGKWGVSPDVTTGAIQIAALSLPIPLSVPTTLVTHTLFLAVGEGKTEHCPGTASKPEAAAGYLCVYTTAANHVTKQVIQESTVSGFNAVIFFEEGAEPLAWGSFAVTAP